MGCKVSLYNHSSYRYMCHSCIPSWCKWYTYQPVTHVSQAPQLVQVLHMQALYVLHGFRVQPVIAVTCLTVTCRFMKSPGEVGQEADVVVHTYAMQAGVSIENHFKLVVCLFLGRIGTMDETIQSCNRLRSSAPGMHRTVYAYLQKPTAASAPTAMAHHIEVSEETLPGQSDNTFMAPATGLAMAAGLHGNVSGPWKEWLEDHNVPFVDGGKMQPEHPTISRLFPPAAPGSFPVRPVSRTQMLKMLMGQKKSNQSTLPQCIGAVNQAGHVLTAVLEAAENTDIIRAQMEQMSHHLMGTNELIPWERLVCAVPYIASLSPSKLGPYVTAVATVFMSFTHYQAYLEDHNSEGGVRWLRSTSPLDQTAALFLHHLLVALMALPPHQPIKPWELTVVTKGRHMQRFMDAYDEYGGQAEPAVGGAGVHVNNKTVWDLTVRSKPAPGTDSRQGVKVWTTNLLVETGMGAMIEDPPAEDGEEEVEVEEEEDRVLRYVRQKTLQNKMRLRLNEDGFRYTLAVLLYAGRNPCPPRCWGKQWTAVRDVMLPPRAIPTEDELRELGVIA